MQRYVCALIGAFVLTFGGPATAQTRLRLAQAVDAALQSRPALKADAEQVAVAQGRLRQAGTWPNPEFQFSNENLRPGQTYTRDVDTLAVVSQPLDVLGKRGRRMDAAAAVVARTTEELELARRQVAQRVELAYWAARGAQERRDLLRASVENFQKIVEYHTAQLSVGAIPEQDVLRVRLEGEQLQISAHLAEADATAAVLTLLSDIGRPVTDSITLTEPLDARVPVEAITADVLDQRSDVRVGHASVAEAEANARLQNAQARPDLDVIFGYKRTLLPDAVAGVNTAVAGIRITIPLMDRNQGNRDAAAAEARRQEQLLAETELQARGDLERARRDYELRSAEVTNTLRPLREHATQISGIARAAYQQGAVDLLRLLDAERSRFDAERAWVDGMVAYQQSVVNLEFAQGAVR
jgi:cobalt-zinc-cadmium efflux system outer membrane protein